MSNLFMNFFKISATLSAFVTLNILLLTVFLTIFPNLFIADSALSSTHKTITNYLLTGITGDLPRQLSIEEYNHITDVRAIFQWLPLLAIATTVFCIIYFRKYSEIELILISRIQIGIIAAVMLALASFTTFFEYFHHIFFPQGNWAFSENSILISLYPEQFWKISFGLIIGLTIVELEFLKRQKRKKNVATSSSQSLSDNT